MSDETSQCGTCKTINGCTCPPPAKAKKCRKCGGRGFRRVDIGSSLDRIARCECRPDNRFYREKPSVPHSSPNGSYRDEFNTTRGIAEEEREACIRILEDLRPRNDREDWTQWAKDRDEVLSRAIAEINARYSDVPLRTDRFANDAAAKALYDTWSDQPGWVPWVERGNSLMQSKARREAGEFVPACTCHPDDRPAGDCPRQYAAGDCMKVRRAVEDDGCPNGDPDCEGRNGDCHDACSTFAARTPTPAAKGE